MRKSAPAVDTTVVIHRTPRGLGWNFGILVLMKIRLKLSGAPLGYTLALVEGTSDSYKAFGKALWSDEQSIPAQLKELVFLRSSLVNECPT